MQDYKPFWDYLNKEEREAIQREYEKHISQGIILPVHEYCTKETPLQLGVLFAMQQLIDLNQSNLSKHSKSYVNAHKKIKENMKKEWKKVIHQKEIVDHLSLDDKILVSLLYDLNPRELGILIRENEIIDLTKV